MTGHNEENRVIQSLVASAALLPFAAIVLKESQLPLGIRLIAWLFWMLALLPALIYLRSAPHSRPPIPFFPVIGLFYGLYYALPVSLGVHGVHWVIRLDPAIDYGDPVRLALIGWCLLLGGYFLTRTRMRVRQRRTVVGSHPARLKGWGFALLVTGLCADAARQLIAVPLAMRAVMQFGVTVVWFATALLLILALRGELRRTERLLFGIAVAANIVLQAGVGSVATLGVYLAVLVFATWAELGYLRPKWIVAALIAAIAVASMRGVAGEFRQQVWFGGERLMPTDRAAIMASMLGERLRSDGLLEVASTGIQTVAMRSANLELFADVVRRTPEQVPYWRGDTYVSLVGAAVPRFLWPGKPTKELGQAFGHRYRYIAPANTTTAVNLPQMVELYANFGPLGVLVGMTFIGILYATLERLTNRPGQPMIMSVAGIALLLPLLNIESDFSLIFGGLLLNALALKGLLLIINSSSTRGTAESRLPLAQPRHG